MAGIAGPEIGALGAAGLLADPRAEPAEIWEKIACAVWLRDAGGRVSYANHAALELFGVPRMLQYQAADSLGWIACDEHGSPLPEDRFPSSVALRTGLPQRHEIIGVTAPERPLQWVLLDCLPLFDDGGRVWGVVSSALDVTALKQAQIGLRVSEDRYRRILETMHEGSCLLATDSTIIFVNSRLCSMLGYAPEELQGRRSVDVFGTSSGALLSRQHRANPAREHDVALRHKDGSTVWALVTGTPVLDDDGHTAGILAMFTDVTDRRRSEERALAAAAQIEQLTADAIYTVDAERRVWSWNRGAEQLFGWTKEEIIGKPAPVIPAEGAGKARQAIERLITTGETVTEEAVRFTKDGRRVSVLGSWSRVPLADGRNGVLCILKDISEHKAFHDQLQKQAKSLALLRERERIAMDLHDGVTQSLYGVALSLGALRRRRGDAANQEAVLGGAISQLTEIIQGIRDYIFELRTGAPEGADLEAGLNAKAQELATATGVQPTLAIEANLRRLSADSVTHLLYIVHEALSNVARHAKATEVAIEALPWGSGIMLSITDNGRGFDSGRRSRRSGDGLRNMRERASQLGANLTIDSLPGVGTTVRVQVP